ncbi:class I SAM-dependent methyltransferase [Comamonas composti]|uniref:class I SAM-dependent methyltransferase n=1 Tax=Comamonas composti TaxID=408558 RepID=UPI0003F92275|nr:class I SAM-dependent methyltransferase [Comamonas composti]
MVDENNHKPRLSIVIIAYNIARELPRTLYTLAPHYQRNINPKDYEIIVVDNGSDEPVDSDLWEAWQAWPNQYRLIRIENASPSPAAAINRGLAKVRGDYVGVMIDGARMCTPGLLGYALSACQSTPVAVVGALGWYLGYDFQRQSIAQGYDKHQEDILLESVDWRRDGYQLYSISAMDESSIDGWYAQIAEFNALFMHRNQWEILGGYDEKFDLPGGGLVNLDMCKRALEQEHAQCVLLLGEATFHQTHGGTATNSSLSKALQDWERWCIQYQAIRGEAYLVPQLRKPVIHFGEMPEPMRLHYLRALAFPSQDSFPLGEDFSNSSWAMPDSIWKISALSEHSKYQSVIAQILKTALQRRQYAELVQVCRMLRQRLPEWKAPLHLLSLLSPWLPRSMASEKSPLCDIVKAALDGGHIFAPAPAAAAVAASASEIEIINSHNNLNHMNAPKRSAFSIESSVFLEPHHLTHPAPWAGHIPFAAWLLSIQKPGTLVELGTYSGISYLAFCQAILENDLPTRAWAVDTWEGDAHAGAYDESIYESLCRAHDPHYTGFSMLLRMTFDDALPYFAPRSVDLLHIDGLHTYEAVRHDFETWLPKISERGVVLFHDTNVYRDDFGVHRLWAELSEKYPSFHFPHSNGLGVLLVGPSQPQELLDLCDAKQESLQSQALAMFGSLGARLERRAEVLMLNIQLKDSTHREQHLQAAGEQRHQWIEKLDTDILTLNQANNQLQNQINERERDAVRLEDRISILERNALELNSTIRHERQQINALMSSRSWRWTSGLRFLGRIARRFGGYQLAKILRRARNAIRYVARGDISGLRRRARQIRREALRQKSLLRNGNAGLSIGVIATSHTVFVAHLIEQALTEIDIDVAVLIGEQKSFDLDYYIVLCPQMFKQLPPGQQRIAFQMEQSVSSRWFTSKYISILEESLAVLDYAQSNLRFLGDKGISYPHTFLLPIGGLPSYSNVIWQQGRENNDDDEKNKKCDVLFYGDINAPRRQEMLNVLRQNFNVRVEGNLFGEDLYLAIKGASLVVNIHYYEGALLETTRIYECLSLGVPVVSESSSDMQDHQHLLDSDAVDFSPIGDIDALVKTVAHKLEQIKNKPEAISQSIETVVETSAQHFKFMLYRALLGIKLLTPKQWERATAMFSLPASKLVLSMPETYLRRDYFLEKTATRMGHAQLFEGVRYVPGWRGCALSYQYMARKALQEGVPYLEISEDDVALDHFYEDRKALVMQWLSENSQEWDVFAGLIAQIHPKTQVLAVHEYQGLTLVVLDRMTSMVHNIYAPSALRALAKWDADNEDPHVNTIDAHLQNHGALRVAVALPFLVGHAEEVQSSLWGFNNVQYSSMISEAQAGLQRMVVEFQAAKVVS